MRGIVVGVDGSDGAKRALAWAIDEARRRSVDVHAVHVWSFPYVGAPPITPALVDLDQLAAESQAMLNDAIADVPTHGVTVHAHVYEGPAPRCLLEAARDADLVVVGSRGRGGFAGLLLGSVSQQVAQHAPCPVVVVPEPG